MLPAEGTIQLLQLVLSLQFWIQLLVFSVCCACVLLENGTDIGPDWRRVAGAASQ